jgi:hypothetical protein
MGNMEFPRSLIAIMLQATSQIIEVQSFSPLVLLIGEMRESEK